MKKKVQKCLSGTVARNGSNTPSLRLILYLLATLPRSCNVSSSSRATISYFRTSLRGLICQPRMQLWQNL